VWLWVWVCGLSVSIGVGECTCLSYYFAWMGVMHLRGRLFCILQ